MVVLRGPGAAHRNVTIFSVLKPGNIAFPWVPLGSEPAEGMLGCPARAALRTHQGYGNFRAWPALDFCEMAD